ncbi:MAG: acyl--CoA ligase [Firmicutes bacterium]|nr:acyl--CoA ligase [Bacillota bacterium]
MKDHYPTLETVPMDWLVSPEMQPEYLELLGYDVPEMTNLAELFVDNRVREGLGEHIAVIQADDDQRYTYNDLMHVSMRLAHVLKNLGVLPGDRVAIRSPNRVEALTMFLAIWRVGGIAVLTPPQARASELPFFLNDTLAKVLFVANKGDYIGETLKCQSEFQSVRHIVAFPDNTGTPYLSLAALLEGVPDFFENQSMPRDSLAVIWHTGGTTGVAKACYHTIRRVVLAGYAGAIGYGVCAGDVHMMPAPLGHAAGWLSRTNLSLLHGITFVELEDFTDYSKILRAIGKYHVTWFIALATSWVGMLHAYEESPGTYNLSSLQRAYAPFISATGGWLYNAWKNLGFTLLNPMGSTAFATWFIAPPLNQTVPPMCLGRPNPGYEVRIVDAESQHLQNVATGEIGRIALRGCSGLTYWNRPEVQNRDVREGWVVLDDLGKQDEEGNLWYMGRADMMISTAGYKVAPVEVEDVISTHPAVEEVAVTSAPDAVRGEVVMAWIVPKKEVHPDAALVEEIQNYVKERISPYKYPRRVAFVKELPHDPVGKIIVKLLKNWASSEKEPEGLLYW